MSLILPDNHGTPQPPSQPEPTAPRPRLSWIDVVLLVVVLGALVALLALGMDLPEAMAVVGVAGLVSAEMRRRFTQS
ncbi:hypothetical protein [Streptomyces sp. Rer75]|uniref:hypothetical protein n=1 Tax=Streptomyces sp. Rer75 TaxID=2750011 RepID=UPI0015D0CCB0|nr:hypothetical protein [Streptomyces sp. Rer75]QLH19286.1 hypothetical protein HYQ63_00055 [Streptomyces sp. Rer75]